MPPVIPVATYRLQLSAKFDFIAAAELVPYLAALGVSHLYASPFLKARAGSTHGYDIVDHNALNPEFGGDEGFAQLSQALSAANMGLILDFVPTTRGGWTSSNGDRARLSPTRSTSNGKRCPIARRAEFFSRFSASPMAMRSRRATSR